MEREPIISSHRVAVDVGGTFTDLVLLDAESGEFRAHKILTTSLHPSEAIMTGIGELLGQVAGDSGATGGKPLPYGRGGDGGAAGDKPLAHERGEGFESIGWLLHATTLATNAVLERKGARTGLITTRGFRDILGIQRQKRFDIYDLQMDKPEPLVPRELVEEVTERVLADGSVATPMEEAEVREAAARLRRQGVEAVAIVFIHGYRNPAHELRAKAILQEEMPETSVCTSFEVSPVFREYERTSTTVMNGYVMPAMASYLGDLEASLSGADFAGRFEIMQSNGGLSSATLMKSLPIRMIESGPAAGAVFAALYSKLAGMPDLLSFDMGGTTAKACLIRQHRPTTTQVFEVDKKRMFPGSGLPITVPSVDLVEVGAGGGSIASVMLGALAVGPESSGANPGPACYMLGGTLPTVTDASLILGYIDPEYFLGGRMAIDPDAAKRAFRDHICPQLGLDEVEAAWGVHRLINHNMAQALRLVSIERGHDPRDLPLMCFGGGGPLHGSRLAVDLPSPTVVIPWLAGVTSSVGLLAADTIYESVRTRHVRLDAIDVDDVSAIFAELAKQVRAALATSREEVSPVLVPSAEMRYIGQGYEVSLELETTQWDASTPQRVGQAFADKYRAIYGVEAPNLPLEIVQWRLSAILPSPKLTLGNREQGTGNREQAGPASGALKKARAAYFPEVGGWITCDVFDRYRLRPGMSIDGPAIVEERESTTIVLPRSKLKVDELGSLVITMGRGGN